MSGYVELPAFRGGEELSKGGAGNPEGASLDASPIGSEKRTPQMCLSHGA